MTSQCSLYNHTGHVQMKPVHVKDRNTTGRPSAMSPPQLMFENPRVDMHGEVARN